VPKKKGKVGCCHDARDSESTDEGACCWAGLRCLREDDKSDHSEQREQVEQRGYCPHRLRAHPERKECRCSEGNDRNYECHGGLKAEKAYQSRYMVVQA